MSATTKLMLAAIAWLLTAIFLLWIAVMDAQAGSRNIVSLAEFRQLDDAAQTYLVGGVIQFTNELGLVCQNPRSVGEYKAALKFRDFDASRTWTSYFNVLFRENGCDIPSEKPNA